MAPSKKQWLKFGLRLVPYISTFVGAINEMKSTTGPERHEAVKKAIPMFVEATEFALDKDLLDDAKVQAATDNLIAAQVAFHNALAEAKAAKEALQGAVNHD